MAWRAQAVKPRMPTQGRKHEIVQVALRLAFKVGPAQLTTGMIAADLGLTQPAIYKHFPSKNELMAEIAQHLGQRIRQNIERVHHVESTPMERLQNLVMGHLQLLEDYPALPEFMLLRDKNDGYINLHQTIQAAMMAFSAALETEVKSAIAKRQFRAKLNVADATTLIFGVIQSLVLRMLVSRNSGILKNDGARLLNLQLAGFMATGDDG